MASGPAGRRGCLRSVALAAALAAAALLARPAATFVEPPAGPSRRAALLGLGSAQLALGMVGPAWAEDAGAGAATAARGPSSPEEAFMQWVMQQTGGNSTAVGEDGLPANQSGLVSLGVGAVVLFTIFSVVKFVVAGAGGLFLYKEFDQQFGKDGRKANKVFEKTLRRIAGEPPDLLEERRLRVVRLNDEVTSFQASLAEQISGPAAAVAVREKVRRTRFLSEWDHWLDGMAVSAEERQKIEEAVLKYQKKEQDRKENTEEARGEWLNNMWTGGFFAGIAYRKFQLANNQDQELKLQEELVADIRKALPETKLKKLKDLFTGSIDLAWLVDREKAGEPNARRKSDRVYVLSFDGDTTASGVALLQQEVTAILSSDVKPQEVVIKLKSPGGTVTGYGLAGAQLMRFRQHGVKLVVCIDELAASGGYLMACCADRILCSPFAAVGSIGVISGTPNAYERLEREGLQVVQTTAGKWKRTIDPFQKPTEEALSKAQDDVQMIYRQFAGWVKENRPGVDIDLVATGEVWFGPEAVSRGLVDELQTSSEYLLQHINRGCEVLSLSYSARPSGLAGSLQAASSPADFMEMAGAYGAAANALQAANAMRAASAMRDPEAALRAAMDAGVSSGGRWPAGVAEPRMEARGPLGGLGDSGF